MSETTTRFDAFISYRRSDGSGIAHWLRRELQSFRLPPALQSTYGRPLTVYLDTAYERGTADFFEGTILPNLRASRWLFVIATPDAHNRAIGSEDWVRREISEFAAGPHGRNIVAVRGAGEFDDPLPGDLLVRFPRIEIVDLRGAGRFSFLNPIRAARLSNEKLKLIAPLLDLPDVEMPRLRQEEEKRQQVRLGATVGVALGVVTAVAGLSVWALQSQYRAVRALEDSMFATGSMIVQSARLTPLPEVERTRRLLLAQGCDLLDNLQRGAGRDPQIDSVVTCLIERARARERFSEFDLAVQAFHEAIALSEARHTTTGRRDSARYLVLASQELVSFYDRHQRFEESQSARLALLERLQSLQNAHSGEEVFISDEAVTHSELAAAHAERGEHGAASESYYKAAAARERIATLPAVDNISVALGLAAQHYREAAFQRVAAGDNDGAMTRFEQVISTAERIDAETILPETLQEAAVASTFLSNAWRSRGDIAQADSRKRSASTYIKRILDSKEASADLRSRAKALHDTLPMQPDN